MKPAGRLVSASCSPTCAAVGLAVAGALLLGSAPSSAQMLSPPAGVYIEAEGQAVFGDSDFEAGMVPTSIFAFTGPKTDLDEGDGWGGALTLGYVWANGWSAAVRYRRLEADDSGGPVDPGIVAFAPGVPVLPGGFPIGVLNAHTKVDSETTILDFEVGNEIAVAGGRLQLFGGLTYTSIERDIALLDDGCGCVPFALLMANDFHGLGPKIGFRGGVPLTDRISFVGGGSVAALFGTSTFKSRLDDPLFPSPQFKDEDHRIVAALDGQAGIAFAIGVGSLTFGYRVDAMLGALDTDQRVSELAILLGFPAIGDRHDDFIEHGPFARFSLPLSGGAN
ncbi:Lpg1974 family pore-forming outer membrane protein [Hyphomicrobium sp.]|uniref:Lpg1974 family pore-forming outer membrane protein n=1 Tax=Hyphomicrobium sp. TaxID=82 RepID=UPI003F7296BB